MSRLVSLHLITFFVALLFISVDPAHAQNNNNEQPKPKAWGKVGLGYSDASDYQGITGLLGGYYSSPYGVLGIRYLFSDKSGSDPLSNSREIQHIRELSVSWGYSKKLSVFTITGSAGVGGLWGEEQIPGGDEQFSVLSVPLEAQLMVRPIPYVEFGTLLTTSINKKTRFPSALIVLQIGNLD